MADPRTHWLPAYPLLLGRSIAHRLLPDRHKGITRYYRDGLAGRLDAADWQLQHHHRSERILEVGCGRDLHLSLTAAIRCGKQAIAYDVQPLADLELVNFTLEALGAQPVTGLDQLATRYGVSYQVADGIQLLTERYDAVASTASFEHIPERALRELVPHLASVLREGGVVTAEIDYRDHWSFIAPVPPDHFYRLSERAFARINTPRMFQNRLRPSDLAALFEANGFRCLDEARTTMALTGGPSSRTPRFQRYAEQDLAVATARTAWIRT
jgi:SAM-dependent methyltransferase